MSGRKASDQRNHLSWELLVKLTDYTRANYASSKLYNASFAEVAGKALGFPVTTANVYGARKAINLPSNYRVRCGGIAAVKAVKRAVKPYADAQARNLVLDELHAINQGLGVLLRKMDELPRR